ncbi:YwpF family protein [Calidifontibacillus erzurumensis]|uniref:YwpF-like protein n=1 Tax=Calidifontibacillus erzurumensis TaxID=2741433 RepID=A0A8J8GE87_9BACI|nr:YwpF family protein [Calidifontibacillus erzurumensis]NSL51747.1 hypothetical protein [Calidifontibacillus erzurumensis]
MKSFRLCSLTIFVETNQTTTKHNIPLEDGLIINKENANDQWLIEGLIQGDFFEFFSNLKATNEPMVVEATITSKENPPASFAAKVRDIKFIGKELQLLLDAKRLKRKDTFSEIILRDLIEKGYSGEELLKEFKRIKKERGNELQSMIENDIRDLKLNNIFFE